MHMSAPKKTVCLNMIVKDEAKIIRRCLESCKPLIDYWVIVDTGSTDGTQEIIKEFMKDIPGELHERPWIDFSHNRNEALDLARGKGDFLLLIDADEYFSYAHDYKLPELDKDYYNVYIDRSSATQYCRALLINNHLNWRWVGVVHEYLDADGPLTWSILEGVKNISGFDGARAQDPQVYAKDAEMIERALLKEPENTRYMFYLAQSYRDSLQQEKSLETYQKRVAMGGWDEEVYWSLLQIANLQDALDKPSETVIDGYLKAFAYRPTRAEPLYHLVRYYNHRGHYLQGYLTGRHAMTLHLEDIKDILFVQNWIYEHGIMLEYSVSAYWIGKFREAQELSFKLLANPKSPPDVRDIVQKNLVWIHANLNPQAQAEVPHA